MKKLFVAIGIFLMTFGSLGSVQATLLSDLGNGGSLTAGDKIFSNWFFESIIAGLDSQLVDASLIDVVPLVDDPLNPGYQVTASAGALTTMGFSSIDFLFGFSVATLSQAPLIKATSLGLTGYEFGPTNTTDGGGGLIDVASYVSDASLNPNSDPFFDRLIDPPAAVFADNLFADVQLADAVMFPTLQSMINVGNLLYIAGDGETDFVSLTMFEQRFAQVAVAAVPEPGTLLLLGAGLLGLANAGRRFKK